jgi:hypothetical protein
VATLRLAVLTVLGASMYLSSALPTPWSVLTFFGASGVALLTLMTERAAT